MKDALNVGPRGSRAAVNAAYSDDKWWRYSTGRRRPRRRHLRPSAGRRGWRALTSGAAGALDGGSREQVRR